MSHEAIKQLQAAVRDCHQIIPVGSGTKEGLVTSSDQVLRWNMQEHVGIVAYDPSEFLITALSGTPVDTLIATLAEHGQYLPFDPLYRAQGATIGGTIASGISGPQKLLYGSLRDFVMEVELIDGLGERVRGGGKVVKNAAGFDLPKLVVGSYGRLGILTEVTLKVLPRPVQQHALQATFDDLKAAVTASQQLLAKPLPIAGLNLTPAGSLTVTLAGSADSLAELVPQVADLLGSAIEVPIQSANIDWLEQMPDDCFLLRIPTDPRNASELSTALTAFDPACQLQFCGGGTLAWCQTRLAPQDFDALLQQQDCSALVVKGPVPELTLLGNRNWVKLARRIQRALDPKGHFLEYPAPDIEHAGVT